MMRCREYNLRNASFALLSIVYISVFLPYRPTDLTLAKFSNGRVLFENAEDCRMCQYACMTMSRIVWLRNISSNTDIICTVYSFMDGRSCRAMFNKFWRLSLKALTQRAIIYWGRYAYTPHEYFENNAVLYDLWHIRFSFMFAASASKTSFQQ